MNHVPPPLPRGVSPSPRSSMRSIFVLCLILGAMPLIIQTFAYEACSTPSSSMVPTLLVGDHFFVNKFAYGLRIPFTQVKIGKRLPERGDVIVFRKSREPDGDQIIKRVIGLPGDVVEVSNRRVTVNGQPLEAKTLPALRLNGDGDSDSEAVAASGPFSLFEPFEEQVGNHRHVALAWTDHVPMAQASGRWKVGRNHVFVLGDNRDNSQDSRFSVGEGGFGQVSVSLITGRADLVWMSVGRGSIRRERLLSAIP